MKRISDILLRYECTIFKTPIELYVQIIIVLYNLDIFGRQIKETTRRGLTDP